MLGVTENIVHNATKVMDMILQHILALFVKQEHIQRELLLVKNVQKDNIKLNQVNITATQLQQVIMFLRKVHLLKPHALQEVIHQQELQAVQLV